ncbi:MAG: hypothetical protein HY814_04245 [Candidatus Riflebacteria bacterium]|nr:hypothetical protein [Candidatus Riflebacteria bacterium]
MIEGNPYGSSCQQHYSALGVDPTATFEDVADAFMERLQRVKSDQAAAAKLLEAFKGITAPDRRAHWVLGVSRTATSAEVDKAAIPLLRKYPSGKSAHPYQAINQAKRNLGDPAKRLLLDLFQFSAELSQEAMPAELKDYEKLDHEFSLPIPANGTSELEFKFPPVNLASYQAEPPKPPVLEFRAEVQDPDELQVELPLDH